MAVENRVHDAILTSMYDVVKPRVEMAVSSITGSSRGIPSSMVHNPDQGDFSGNTEHTPLMLAPRRVDLNMDQAKYVETRNIENFEDDDFPAMRLNSDRQGHAHHTYLNGKKISVHEKKWFPLFLSVVQFKPQTAFEIL